jgi:hypothetical protein
MAYSPLARLNMNDTAAHKFVPSLVHLVEGDDARVGLTSLPLEPTSRHAHIRDSYEPWN